VGGHRLSDQQVALNQAQAWRMVFQWVEEDRFAVTQERACSLHAVAAQGEALAWGHFRSGGVTIAGTDYEPPAAGRLPELFEQMVAGMGSMADIYDQAISLFLTMARCQFFYDVNKRMGRFMMNGHLLSHGYPAINLPARRRLEFHQLMLNFYTNNDQQPMNVFLRSCLSDRVIAIMREP